MVDRICAICGASFSVYPSSPAKTCSPSCRSKLKSRSQTGRRHPWSAEARKRLQDRPTPEQLSLGTHAAMALPEGQRGPANRACKVWRLRSPDGHEFEFVGLLPWARENAWRFGETGEDGARRIASGIRQVARSMRGQTPRIVGNYKGWQLLALPQEKTEKSSGA